MLTTKHREAQKKHEQRASGHEDPHEEHLRVEALVELDDLHSLVEHGVEVEVALGIPVMDVKRSRSWIILEVILYTVTQVVFHIGLGTAFLEVDTRVNYLPGLLNICSYAHHQPKGICKERVTKPI